MNERIEKLVGQAKFMAEETINKQIPKNAELEAFAEKFAELIIRESIWIAYHSHALSKDAKFTDHLDAIKERFGLD